MPVSTLNSCNASIDGKKMYELKFTSVLLMPSSVLARHQQIDKDMQAAIAQGADPNLAARRANQLHAQVGQP